ncbi:MAG: hypothetical protein COC22_00540 [Flavobacteriaceae bacterium]|nr:MAG: hypothetical protein COC22_00540 [Flavobacteriaceae bacterium]
MVDVQVVQGSTHFMFGFVLGYALFRLLLVACPRHDKLAIYAPFIPFIVGMWFAVPYVFELGGMGGLQQYIGLLTNLFGAYDWLHHNSFVANYLTGLNKVAVVCGLIYLLIVLHYIQLIKSLRRRKARKRRGSYAS